MLPRLTLPVFMNRHNLPALSRGEALWKALADIDAHRADNGGPKPTNYALAWRLDLMERKALCLFHRVPESSAASTAALRLAAEKGVRL